MTERGRAFYCPDALWRKAKAQAKKDGYVSVSAWLRELIEGAIPEQVKRKR